MLLKWMKKRGCEPREFTSIGTVTLLIGLFVVAMGERMNRAYDSGSESFLGMPLNEAICIVVLLAGGALIGMSIVFNVVGLRARRGGG
jgi:hypothetical protein